LVPPQLSQCAAQRCEMPLDNLRLDLSWAHG